MISSAKISEIKKSKKISWFQKMLFFELLSIFRKEGRCDVLNSELIENLGVCRRYLQHGLYVLEKNKLIRRVWIKKGTVREIHIVGLKTLKKEMPVEKSKKNDDVQDDKKQDFEKLWKAYRPLHTNKGSKIDSFNKYCRIINKKIATADLLYRCTVNYIDNCHKKDVYTKNVSVWLNIDKRHWLEFDCENENENEKESNKIEKILLSYGDSNVYCEIVNDVKQQFGIEYWRKYWLGKVFLRRNRLVYIGSPQLFDEVKKSFNKITVDKINK